MPVFRTSVICAAAILILAACAQFSKTTNPENSNSDVGTAPVVPSPQTVEPVEPENTNKATALLNAGIKNFEDAKYDHAEKNLKAALKLDFLDTTQIVTAHKYLAFIYSVSNRKTLSRKAFEKAFELDPYFTLSPAEAGHPLWGPIYRSVKAKFNPDKTSR
jgi:Tfp pilus assembly protein PilF